MLNRHTPTLSAVLITLALIISAGCEQSNQLQIKQARLTVQENIELKQQIESLKEEIQKQKDLLVKSEKEKAEIIEQTGDSTLKIMKILAETGKENEQLSEQIAQLKNKIKELQAKLAEAAPD